MTRARSFNTFVLSALAVLLAGIAGCAQDARSSNHMSPRQIAEHDIRMAIIRTEANRLRDQHPNRELFVAEGQEEDPQNPSPHLLAALEKLPRVKPFAACDFKEEGITDKTTGARGSVLQLGSIHWEESDTATLDATVSASKGLSIARVYHMQKENGQWTVKQIRSIGATSDAPSPETH